MLKETAMRTTIEEIEQGKVTYANIPATPFDQTSANQLADALSKNTSVTRLNLSSCELVDNEFITIGTVLLNREVQLSELNLDYNSLTSKSVSLLCELIQAEKIKTLNLYRVDDILNDTDSMNQLNSVCNSSNVKLNIENPRRRPNYASTFFPEHKEDISKIYSDMGLLQEQKESPKNRS
jgi:hypothetical protein